MDPPCGAPILWGISPDFSGLSPCYRWIAYVLLTRAPVAGKGIATSPLPLDLHVLGLSLAFILSQDQTLRCIISFFIIPSKTLPSLPLRERLAIRRFWRWLFLLVSYYFVYHSLKDLSLFPHRFSRSAYRLFPKSECKDRAFLFPHQIFLLLFFIFFLLKSTKYW